MKLQNIFLIIFTWSHLSFTDTLSPQEYAAIKIQTAFRASQARKTAHNLRLEKFQNTILNPIPFKEFQHTICTGEYLDRPDLLSNFVQIVNQETVSCPKEFLDPKFKNRFDLHTIQLYQTICLDTFQDRVIQEIHNNKMSWTNAVSIPARSITAAPKYPITGTCPECNPPHKYLVLADIFDELADQLLPRFLPILSAKTLHKYQEYDYTVGSITLFGQQIATPMDNTQNDQFIIKVLLDDALSSCLQDYFLSLGKPAHHKYDDLPDDEINWTLAAQTIFYLGQFFFDNKIEALTKLGGQKWIKQQPEDIQQIINAHLQTIQPQSWLSKIKNSLYQYADDAKKEAQYYLNR